MIEPKEGVPPSPARLAALAASIREFGVRAILHEPLEDRAEASRALAARTGTRVVPLAPSVGRPEGTVNLMGCGRDEARDEAGHTDGYARAATPVTSAQVWKAWVRAARYWAAGR